MTQNQLSPVRVYGGSSKCTLNLSEPFLDRNRNSLLVDSSMSASIHWFYGSARDDRGMMMNESVDL